MIIIQISLFISFFVNCSCTFEYWMFIFFLFICQALYILKILTKVILITIVIPPGKAMETSGSLQDHSRVHGESEDLDRMFALSDPLGKATWEVKSSSRWNRRPCSVHAAQWMAQVMVETSREVVTLHTRTCVCLVQSVPQYSLAVWTLSCSPNLRGSGGLDWH